jgi:hypothetical protein
VNYQVGGSAISGSDFVALPNSVVILTGQSSAQIVVTPINDLAVEADETIIVTLADNLAYTVGAQQSATVILSDNDTPDQILPGNIADLKTSTVTQTSVTLNWTAPGDEGSTGSATSYDLRYSTTAMNQATFVTATPVPGAPPPLAAGAAQTFSVPGLLCGRTYYFAIKAVDEANNISAISNIAKGKTAACNKLIVTPKTLPVGEVNVAYNESVNLTGGVAPYGVQIDSAKLPPGVSYTSSFSGTPTLAKTFFVPAVITDAVGSAQKVTFKLKVAKPLTITTTSLKAGKAGVNYTATLRAKNGVKPYTWSAPPLPVGLMLDTATGKITGVVTAATGPVEVNFQATDALGATATQLLTLTFN